MSESENIQDLSKGNNGNYSATVFRYLKDLKQCANALRCTLAM